MPSLPLSLPEILNLDPSGVRRSITPCPSVWQSSCPKFLSSARPILLTTAYGLCGGAAAVVFEVAINLVYNGTFLRFAGLVKADEAVARRVSWG